MYTKPTAPLKNFWGHKKTPLGRIRVNLFITIFVLNILIYLIQFSTRKGAANLNKIN